MRAAKIIALPTVFSESLTGTATFFKCIPIKTPPISMPASAFIFSTATGEIIDVRRK